MIPRSMRHRPSKRPQGYYIHGHEARPCEHTHALVVRRPENVLRAWLASPRDTTTIPTPSKATATQHGLHRSVTQPSSSPTLPCVRCVQRQGARTPARRHCTNAAGAVGENATTEARVWPNNCWWYHKPEHAHRAVRECSGQRPLRQARRPPSERMLLPTPAAKCMAITTPLGPSPCQSMLPRRGKTRSAATCRNHGTQRVAGGRGFALAPDFKDTAALRTSTWGRQQCATLADTSARHILQWEAYTKSHDASTLPPLLRGPPVYDHRPRHKIT